MTRLRAERSQRCPPRAEPIDSWLLSSALIPLINYSLQPRFLRWGCGQPPPTAGPGEGRTELLAAPREGGGRVTRVDPRTPHRGSLSEVGASQ